MRGEFCVPHWFTALKHHSALWRETRTGLPASLPHFRFDERAGDGQVHVRSLAGWPSDFQLSPCFRMDRERPVKTTEARCPTRHNLKVETEQSFKLVVPATCRGFQSQARSDPMSFFVLAWAFSRTFVNPSSIAFHLAES
jgi:hypothetical protein